MFRKLGIAAALAAISSARGQSHSTISKADFTPRAESLVKAHLDEGVASVAVAVIRGNDTLMFRGFGLADVNAKLPATPRTVYRIGSMTKQFTAAAVMRLVEQGKVKLDDDLSKFVPQFPLQGKHVTIRQLLNHTSGIHSYTSSPEWRKTWDKDLTPDQIIAFVARDTFDFAPGSAWRYDNTGYVLLGMVIEKATRQKYANYLDAQFFKPLGLRQTSYCRSKPTDLTYALGYVRGPEPAEHMSLTHLFAAGALCSTVGDLVRWQRALAAGKVVSAASYALMSTADTLNNGSRINYGFGLEPGSFNGHKTIGHDGGISGFATVGTFVPDDTLNVVVFTNSGDVPSYWLTMNLLRVAYGLAPEGKPPRPPTQPLPPAERDAVVGDYTLKSPLGRSLPIKFFAEGGRLMAQAEGQRASELFYLGDHAFGVAFDSALRFTFVIDAQGKATRVILLQNGGTVEGARNP